MEEELVEAEKPKINLLEVLFDDEGELKETTKSKQHLPPVGIDEYAQMKLQETVIATFGTAIYEKNDKNQETDEMGSTSK